MSNTLQTVSIEDNRIVRLEKDTKYLMQELKNCNDYIKSVREMTNLNQQYDMFRMAMGKFDEVLNRIDLVERTIAEIQNKYAPLDYRDVSLDEIRTAYQDSGFLLKNIAVKFSIDTSTASRWLSGDSEMPKKTRFELFTFLKKGIIQNANV